MKLLSDNVDVTKIKDYQSFKFNMRNPEWLVGLDGGNKHNSTLHALNEGTVEPLPNDSTTTTSNVIQEEGSLFQLHLNMQNLYHLFQFIVKQKPGIRFENRVDSDASSDCILHSIYTDVNCKGTFRNGSSRIDDEENSEKHASNNEDSIENIDLLSSSDDASTEAEEKSMQDGIASSKREEVRTKGWNCRILQIICHLIFVVVHSETFFIILR